MVRADESGIQVKQKALTLQAILNNHQTMTSSSDYLSYAELQNAIENDDTDNNFKIAADFLLTAITDYPSLNIKEPVDLVAALREALNDKLTFDILDNYLKSLSPYKDAWKMEAITSLLEMFDFERKNIFDRVIELDTIIRQLTKHYRNNKSKWADQI